VLPYTLTLAKLAPYFKILVHLQSGNDYIMVEADIHLRLFPTSTLDTSEVVEPLFSCLKGSWLHHYTVTQAKLGPRFMNFGSLVE
jgi:hypothetical protein